MRFPPEIIQEVKDRTSIVAFVGETVVLKKSGHNHKGLCPFHQEKSPSFMVHEDKQIFHCFGCGVGGDVIAFVMQRDGVPFPEAVRYLAERAAVELPVEGDERAAAAAQEAQKRKKLLLRANMVAAEYYTECLHSEAGAAAREYLRARGYDDLAFLDLHGIGFVGSAWDGLGKHLAQRNVPIELAVELGLVRERSNKSGHYDFFRERVMFPIRDVRGAVIGFGGRVLPKPEGDDEVAKYLNSSDSAIFHKGKTLYGFPIAAGAMREQERVIVVEGYLDVLALQQAGIGEAVAPLGTALTEDHLRLIRRYTTNLFIVFDGDAAGMRAAERSLPLCLQANLVPRVVILPAGEDPDTIIRQHGREHLEERLSSAPTLFEWFIDATVAAAEPGTAGQVQIINNLRPLFAQLKDVVQAARYVERLARTLRLERGVVARALRNQGGLPQQKPVEAPRRNERSDAPKAERACLELILHVPGGMAALAEEISPEDFHYPLYRQLAQRCWDFYAKHGKIEVTQLCGEDCDTELRSAMTELAFQGEKYQDVEDLAQTVSDFVAALEKPHREAQLSALNEQIAEAERAGEHERLMELMAQKQELLRTQHLSGSDRL